MSDYHLDAEERERQDRLQDEIDRHEAMYARIRSEMESNLNFSSSDKDRAIDAAALGLMRLMQAEIAKVEEPLRAAKERLQTADTAADRGLGDANVQLSVALAVMTLQEHQPKSLAPHPQAAYLVQQAILVAQRLIGDARNTLDAMPF